MPITMSGSPSSPLKGSPSGSSPKSGSPGRAGYRSTRSPSPPASRKEAEKNIGWMSTARPFVLTKADEYIESEKQHYEKEMNRQKLLDKDAIAAHEKADQVAKERALWISRQRAREGKEKISKEFLAKERKLCLQEWKEDQVLEPGHGPKRWLWPVARDHPRMWIAGQDIPVREKDREQSTSWQSSPGARAKVNLSPTVHRIPGE